MIVTDEVIVVSEQDDQQVPVCVEIVNISPNVTVETPFQVSLSALDGTAG